MNKYDIGFSTRPIHLPCGATAHFDHDSGISYRCEECMAVVGSVGQPRQCQNAMKKYDVLRELGGHVQWDYEKGCEKCTN